MKKIVKQISKTCWEWVEPTGMDTGGFQSGASARVSRSNTTAGLPHYMVWANVGADPSNGSAENDHTSWNDVQKQ